MINKPLVVLSGATAVGKTELSIALAKRINGSIISADSMQVYRGFNIGTAKISPQEMDGVPHYLIDILEPEEEFNVFQFQHRAKEAIHEIYDRNRIPIITGGTGFYIQSVLYDIDFSKEHTDSSYRKELEILAEKEGAEYLHRMLEQVDPAAAAQIHPHNQKRVIRALEYHKETGTPISMHNAQQLARKCSYNCAYFVLNRERSIVYERINQRVEQMMEAGLKEEVQSLLIQGIPREALAMQGLGYKEMVRYLDGELSMDEAIALLKQSTRHFAKRQITWFRRERDVIWMNYEDYESKASMLEAMIDILKEKKIIVPIS